MLNYGTIKKSFYYNSIEVLIDFINSVITIHAFLEATLFFTSASNTYDRMNFQLLIIHFFISTNSVKTKRQKLVKNKSQLRKL